LDDWFPVTGVSPPLTRAHSRHRYPMPTRQTTSGIREVPSSVARPQGRVSRSEPTIAAGARKRRRRRGTTGAADADGGSIPIGVIALSRALREARSNAGLTQRAAADRIGIHFVTLYTWESEQQRAQPSGKNLAKAARIYQTTPDAIRRRASELEAAGAAGGLEPLPETRGRRVRPLPKTGGRPRSSRAAAAAADEAMPIAMSAASDEAGGSESTALMVMQDAEVPIPGVSRRVYGRVFRLLADLADQTNLSPTQLVGVQRALTAPALLGVFTPLNDGPHEEDDVLAAIDAAAVAVRTYVASRRVASAQKRAR
jgi:transcriptional regulator with XRE-family HTH domain